MRALGEMAVYHPISGSFSEYARPYVGEFAGFATGWSYWLYAVAGPMAELTAAGIYMHCWFSSLPQWIPALVGLAVLYLVHWMSVRLFGEFEFLVRDHQVVAIVGLILIELVVVITGWTALGHGATISNLWNHGVFFPQGAKGVFLTLQLAVFAFIGVEMLGITAGEAADPEKTLPRAVNNVIWRILIFYIGALRRTGEAVPAFHLRGAPWTALLVLAAVVGVAISMGFTSGTRIGLYAGAVGAVLIVVAYAARQWQLRGAAARVPEPAIARDQAREGLALT
jgi:AAT family amino acid transporter